MRERHFQSGDKHPRTCTCTECHKKRLLAMEEASRPKRKRKPKSLRGKPVSMESSGEGLASSDQSRFSKDAIDEAMRILGIDQSTDTVDE